MVDTRIAGIVRVREDDHQRSHAGDANKEVGKGVHEEPSSIAKVLLLHARNAHGLDHEVVTKSDQTRRGCSR